MQTITSAKTSVNVIPRVFTRCQFDQGTVNLDIGGGRFDRATEYMAEVHGCTNLVYDPYNRTPEHNEAVLARARHGVDTVTISNVLNVIDSEQARLEVLRMAAKFLKPEGFCYISVYEGNKSGVGGPTRAGWQANRLLDSYIPEIERVFDSGRKKHGVLVCFNPYAE